MNQIMTYECMGFHESLPKGKASGDLTVDASAVRCVVAGQTLRLPLQGLQVHMGGASNRLVFFSHPLVKGWSFYTSDLRILRDPHLHNQADIAALLNKAKHKRLAGWGLLAGVLLLVVAVPLLLVLRMDVLTGMLAKQIPPSWEEQLGESTLAQYQLGKTLMPQEQVEKLLKPLTSPLLDALGSSQYQYRFYIVNDGSLNAFALPGGQIVIHSALIVRADAAEELLGVLAHEIIHVEAQHGVRGVMGTAGIYLLASAVLGDMSGLMATLGGAAPLLLNQSYSRRFETESDVKGHALLLKARINPTGLASFFEKIIAEEKKQLAKIADEENRELVKDALQFLSTHPASEERIAQLAQLSAQAGQQDYRDLTAEFAQLQAEVKQFVTASENEEGVNNEN